MKARKQIPLLQLILARVYHDPSYHILLSQNELLKAQAFLQALNVRLARNQESSIVKEGSHEREMNSD